MPFNVSSVLTDMENWATKAVNRFLALESRVTTLETEVATLQAANNTTSSVPKT